MNGTLNPHAPAKKYEFPAPTVVETSEYTIPLSLLRKGLTIHIPPITTANVGDRGAVAFDSKYGSTGKGFEIADPQQPITIAFAPDDLGGIAGTGRIQYVMLSGPIGASDLREAYFQETMPTPRVKGLEETGRDAYTLPDETAETGLIITIGPYEHIAAGDRVMFCANASAETSGEWQEHTVNEAEVVTGLEFTYPISKLKALRPGQITFGYSFIQNEVWRSSRFIDLTLLPLLPNPEPKYQEPSGMGPDIFLLVVEQEDGQYYAPVVQSFASESAAQGDQLLLMIDREGNGLTYTVEVENPTSEVTFKIPESDLLSMSGQVIRMATLWQRSAEVLITSDGKDWVVSGAVKKSRDKA